MGLFGLIKKGIKKLGKWQPLKTVKKVAGFIPGGAAIASGVEKGIEIFKKRRQAGESPGDAFAATAGLNIQTPEDQAKSTGILIAVGVGALLLILLMRRR